MKNKTDIDTIFKDEIILITFGGSKTSGLSRARIRAFSNETGAFYQEERIIENKAFHKNIESEELKDYFTSCILDEFRNAVIFSSSADYYVKRIKSGELSILRKKPTKSETAVLTHDKNKNYLIPEGEPIGFLVSLGIMSPEGKVYKAHYSKFRQINRFIELVDDCYEQFAQKNPVRIYDMGCGKGYLTFALHYYFNVLKGKKTNITGIDLKKDVMINLNGIVESLELEGIEFIPGDINDSNLREPDLVVALHACDVATDLAMAKAVESRTEVIITVPCCQHELFRQITNRELSPILNYGIMKDKFTEIATNALRGLALEAVGYKVDMPEFTSLEHTMKNIMIRAIKACDFNKKKEEEYMEFCRLLEVSPSAALIIEAAKGNAAEG